MFLYHYNEDFKKKGKQIVFTKITPIFIKLRVFIITLFKEYLLVIPFILTVIRGCTDCCTMSRIVYEDV